MQYVVFHVPHELIVRITSTVAFQVTEAVKVNSTRYIKTTSKALVDHLCKYLAMRISLDLPMQDASKNGQLPSSPKTPFSSVKDLTIFIVPSAGNIVELEGSMTLTQVNEKYWKVNKPLEMFYSFQRV